MTVEVNIERVGCYKKNADRTATPGAFPSLLNEDPRLYGVLNFEMDLNRGCENYKDEGMGDVFNSICDYLKKTKERGTPLKKAINAEFVSNRRNLATFAESVYLKNTVDIRALRKNGVIFLCDTKSENVVADPNAYGGGFKFELNMTLNAEGEPHDDDEPPSHAECTKTVMRIDLTNKAEEQIRVLYSAETDAVDKKGKFVEINTTSKNYFNWLRTQSLHHYMQSFLGNVSYIVKGQIDRQSKIVKRIDKTWTHTIPMKVKEAKEVEGEKSWKWDPKICMEHVFDILQKIKDELPNDDEAIIVRMRRGDISYEWTDAEKCTFVDPQFLEHFESE